MTSDSAGWYLVTEVRPPMAKIEPAADTDYRAPCPTGTVTLSADSMFDLHVASTAVLSSVGTPRSLPYPNPALSVTGSIYERTSNETRPVAGATVDLDNYGFLLSTTLSSAEGRYLLCSFPPGAGTDQSVLVRVRKEGFQPAVAETTHGAELNVELVRD